MDSAYSGDYRIISIKGNQVDVKSSTDKRMKMVHILHVLDICIFIKQHTSFRSIDLLLNFGAALVIHFYSLNINILCIIWTINILMDTSHYKVINKKILKGNPNGIESDKIGINQPEPINN